MAFIISLLLGISVASIIFFSFFDETSLLEVRIKKLPKKILLCMKINIQGELLSTAEPLVMGILNVTENSFYDGGQYLTPSSILRRVEKLLTDGAAIIDVGAVSTRPGAADISLDEELSIVRQTVSLIRKNFPSAIISVDTWRASVAEVAAVFAVTNRDVLNME